jgi:hypothetical protein
MKSSTILLILVCFFFISSSLYSSSSYFSARGEVSENVLSASSWHTPEEAVEEVGEALEASASALYQLGGEDLQTNFSQEEFNQAVAAAGIEIEKVTVVEVPRIFGVNGEWAETVLELTVSDGTSQKFKVVFKKENGLWRIFGTEEM